MIIKIIFSWHEVGIYDLPAAVNYITTLTQRRIFYIGHSLGAVKIAVMASERPDVAKKVKMVITLAPAVYEKNIRQPLIKAVSKNWKALKVCNHL